MEISIFIDILFIKKTYFFLKTILYLKYYLVLKTLLFKIILCLKLYLFFKKLLLTQNTASLGSNLVWNTTTSEYNCISDKSS